MLIRAHRRQVQPLPACAMRRTSGVVSDTFAGIAGAGHAVLPDIVARL